MNDKAFAVVVMLVVLTSCATPGEVAKPLEMAASECLKKGESYIEAEKCLNKRGLKMKHINWEKDLDTYTIHKCRPSDRHMLVGACASLYVGVTKSGIVEKWSISEGYDGP